MLLRFLCIERGRKMANHIVLYQPEIPANTGNIARTCAGTNTYLHLIHPLGFSTEDKYLKRAGLDYWDKVKVVHHESVEDFFATENPGYLYYIETFGTTKYTDIDYSNTELDYYIMFGQETKGIPKELIEKNGGFEQCLLIPQSINVRSLNLSNTAAIVIYEILRQQQFNGL